MVTSGILWDRRGEHLIQISIRTSDLT